MFSVSVSAEETEEYDVFLLPVISEKMLEDQRYDQIQVYWDKNSNIPFVSIDQATSIVGGSCNYKTGWYTVDKDYFYFRYNSQDDMKLYLGNSDYGILLLDGNLFESRLIHGRWYVDFWGFCYMFDEKFEKIDSNISAKDGFNTDDIAKYKLFMEKNYFPFFLYISDGYNLSSAYEDIMQYKGNYVWNYSKYPESETWFKNIMGSSEANIKTFSYNYLSNVVCDWGNTVSAAVVPYKPDEHYTEALINITNINYLKYLVEYNKYDNNYYSLTKGDSLYTALNSYNVAEDFINNKIPEDLQKALKGFTIFLDTYQTVAQTIRMYKYLDSIDSRRIQLLQDSIINNTNLSSMAENDQKTRKWIEKLSVYSTGATSVSHEKFKEFIDDFNLPFNPAKYHIRNPYLTILNYSLNNSASLKDSAEKLTDSYRNQTKQVFDTLENGYESIVSSVGNEVLINILESSPKTKPVALVIGLIDKLMSASKVEFGETLKKSELLYQCEYIEQVLLQGLDERDKHNLRSRLSMLLRASLFCHLLVPDSSTKDIKDICSLLYDIDYDSDNLRYYNDPRNPQPFNDIKELIVDYKTERVNKGTISGKVLTEDKNPIKNAKIEVYTSSGDTATRFGEDECYTNDKGEFSISVPEGKYLLVITCDGYDPVNINDVVVEKGKTNVNNIVLKPNSNYSAMDLIDKTIPEIIELMGEEFEFARLTYPEIRFSNSKVFPGLSFCVELKSEDSVEVKGLVDNEWVINLNGKNAKEELKTGIYKLSYIATVGSDAYVADNINVGMSYKSITNKYGKLSATVGRPPHIRGTMRVEDGFIKCVINENKKSMELYFRNEGLVKSESDWNKTFTYDDLVDAGLKLYCGVVYAKSDDWQTAYNNLLNEALEKGGGNQCAFDLCDMNNDGVPELFLSEGYAHYSFCKVYSFISGQIIYFKELDGEMGLLAVDKNEKVIVSEGYTNGVGSFWTLYSRIDSDGNVSSDYFEFIGGLGKIEYYFNNNSVTEEEYKAEKQKYANLNTNLIGRGNILTKENIDLVISNY